MIKKYRIYQYLINHSGKEIKQSYIKEVCNCTKMYSSKTLKQLINKGIVIRERRNTIKVINPYILCSILAFERKLPKPVLFRAPIYRDMMHILNKTTHSITNTSALEIKNKEKPRIIHAHVLVKDVDFLLDNFNTARRDANLIVYPAFPSQFNTQQINKGHYLATDLDIYVDLLQHGKTKEAISFAHENKLF